jgi:hypothetical protein
MILKVTRRGEVLTSSQIRERILQEAGVEIRGVAQLIKTYLIGEYMERLLPENSDEPSRYRRLR